MTISPYISRIVDDIQLLIAFGLAISLLGNVIVFLEHLAEYRRQIVKFIVISIEIVIIIGIYLRVKYFHIR